MTTCTTCFIEKNDSLFPQWKGKRSGRKCNACRINTNNVRKANDPEFVKRMNEASRLSMIKRRADPIIGPIIKELLRNRPKPIRTEKVSAADIKRNASRREYLRQKSADHYAANKADYLARQLLRSGKIARQSFEGKSFDEGLAFMYKHCATGYHVDHIIPLNGKLVSGLHVWWNLQYLTAHQNLSKRNKFDIDRYDAWLANCQVGSFLG